MATDPWGIDDGYFDVRGTWHATSPETRTALRRGHDRRRRPAPRAVAAAVGRAGRGGGAAARPVRAAPRGRHRGPGRGSPAPRPAHRLPRPAPARRRPDHAADRDARPLPPARRPAGVGPGGPAARVPVDGELGHRRPRRPAARSAPGPRAGAPGWWRSARCTRRCRSTASSPARTSRRAAGGRNPLALRIEDVPGAAGDAGRRASSAPGAAGSTTARSSTATRCGRSSGGRSSRCGTTAAPTCGSTGGATEMGADLETYARFCALAEHHGTGWHGLARGAPPPRPRRRWPPFAAAHADRVAFWAWLQFLLDEQLRRAEEPLPLLTDLAIGVDPDGADAWVMQDLLAHGVRVGRPARRVQPRRAGLGPAAVRAPRPARRRLRPARPPLAGGDGPRRRAAHRPRDGPVPAVLDPARRRPGRRRLRPLPGRRAARRPRHRERARRRRRRRRGPRHGRARGPHGAGRRRAAVVPAGVVRGRPARGVPRAGPRRGHHPRPADRGRRVVGRGRGRPAGRRASSPTSPRSSASGAGSWA